MLQRLAASYGRAGRNRPRSILFGSVLAIAVAVPPGATYNPERMSNSPLLRFESLIRRLVEQPFVWLSGEALDPFGMANHLLQLLLDERQNGRQVEQFVITVNPAHLGDGGRRADQLVELVTAYMTLLAERTGQVLGDPPVIRLEGDPAVGLRVATVVAHEEATQAPPNTQLFDRDPQHTVSSAIRGVDAYLIVGGRQHVPLDQPVVRIGRRTDNDIVLDSPSVSRHHAQIRWRGGDFVLFDTSSHGRTLVNGEPVREQILRPGDVIALSDVLLIYGEERLEDDGSGTRPVSSTWLKPPE